MVKVFVCLCSCAGEQETGLCTHFAVCARENGTSKRRRVGRWCSPSESPVKASRPRLFFFSWVVGMVWKSSLKAIRNKSGSRHGTSSRLFLSPGTHFSACSHLYEYGYCSAVLVLVHTELLLQPTPATPGPLPLVLTYYVESVVRWAIYVQASFLATSPSDCLRPAKT